MTKEAALKNAIGFPLPKDTIEKALIDAGLTASEDYSKADTKGIDLCAAGLLFFLLTSPDIKEADFARTLPSEGKLKTAYRFLVKKWGEPDLLPADDVPTISSVSPW